MTTEKLHHPVGVGYTLASGKLYCKVDEFHAWAEQLMDRPILTHEFSSEKLWEEMRETFEKRQLEALS